jgi:hypothetical protein
MMAMNHQRGLQGMVSEKRPVAPREPNTSSVLMWWKRKRGCSSCGHQWRYELWGGSGSISRSGWFPCRLRGQPYRAVIGAFTTRNSRRSLRSWRFSHISSQPWACIDPSFVLHQC